MKSDNGRIRYQFFTLKIIFLIYLILLVSCQKESYSSSTPSPSMHAPTRTSVVSKPTQALLLSTMEKLDSTNTPLPTLSPTPEKTSTNARFRLFDLLAPGENIVFDHSILSPSTNTERPLPGDIVFEVRLTQDGKKMIRYATDPKREFLIIDTISGEQNRVPGLDDCLPKTRTDWSPDGKMIVSACHDAITVQSFPDGKEITRIPLNYPDMPFTFSIGDPVFSRDGKWIAYIIYDHRMTPEDKKDRVFVIDANCLTQPGNCQEKTKLAVDLKPAGYNRIDWGFQNRLIILSQEIHQFIVFDMTNEKVLQEIALPNQFDVRSFAVSPDGKDVLFGQLNEDKKGSTIYSISLGDGNTTSIYYKEGYRAINVYFMIKK